MLDLNMIVFTVLAPNVVIIVAVLKSWLKISGVTTVIASFLVGIAIALINVPKVIPTWPQAIPLGLYAGGVAAFGWKTVANLMRHANR